MWLHLSNWQLTKRDKVLHNWPHVCSQIRHETLVSNSAWGLQKTKKTDRPVLLAAWYIRLASKSLCECMGAAHWLLWKDWQALSCFEVFLKSDGRDYSYSLEARKKWRYFVSKSCLKRCERVCNEFLDMFGWSQIIYAGFFRQGIKWVHWVGSSNDLKSDLGEPEWKHIAGMSKLFANRCQND